MEPKNFKGEDLSRVTQVYRVAQYNIACCYSSINQVCLLPLPLSHSPSLGVPVLVDNAPCRQ